MAVRNKMDDTEVPENVDVYFAADGSRIVSDNTVVVDDALMRGVKSFEQAMAAAEALYGDVKSFSGEMGNGFRILQDKKELEGVRCLFLNWKFTDGDFGVFVSAAVVTEDNRKLIVNDGGSGMASDLMEYSARTGRFGGMVADNGLRRSEYTTCKGCSAPRNAREETCAHIMHNGSVCGDTDTGRGIGETYYVDLSA